MQNMHKSMYLHILHIYALPTLLMITVRVSGSLVDEAAVRAGLTPTAFRFTVDSLSSFVPQGPVPYEVWAKSASAFWVWAIGKYRTEIDVFTILPYVGRNSKARFMHAVWAVRNLLQESVAGGGASPMLSDFSVHKPLWSYG